ncbi:TetR/AcrR family transcriptional regulator [Streptomyces sp. NPDC020379]|uniref:TetR/AcrR family transcriptional regulator n=1 Tax=Streptomyces sp. NPDC020379 TaxID=3365071 RepID=UPI00378F0CE3
MNLEQVARASGVARSTVYAIFGSRAGLFDVLARDVLDRAGYSQVLQAAEHPTAEGYLREVIGATVRMHAAERDALRVIYSMTRCHPDALAGAGGRLEQARSDGVRYLVQRLKDAGSLCEKCTEGAVDALWVVTSFDTFDLLHTDRGLTVAAVTERLTTMAGHMLASVHHGCPADRRGPRSDTAPQDARGHGRAHPGRAPIPRDAVAAGRGARCGGSRCAALPGVWGSLSRPRFRGWWCPRAASVPGPGKSGGSTRRCPR